MGCCQEPERTPINWRKVLGWAMIAAALGTAALLLTALTGWWIGMISMLVTLGLVTLLFIGIRFAVLND